MSTTPSLSRHELVLNKDKDKNVENYCRQSYKFLLLLLYLVYMDIKSVTCLLNAGKMTTGELRINSSLL